MKNINCKNNIINILESKEILIIPEIGINHCGSLKVAKKMVLSAKKVGAKIIKHQTHVIESEMTKDAKNVVPGNSKNSILDIMKKCALNEKEEMELKKYTESLGLIYLSTPFSKAAADRLHKMNVDAYKIGSGEMNNFPLLDYVASFGKPMIVSTGMNKMSDIEEAIKILKKRKVYFALLHTTNLYPTEPSQIRLGAMVEMIKKFPDVPIGLSDHSLNNYSSYVAIGLGAKIIERHYTDKKSRKGPDIKCSMNQKDLKDLINAAVQIPKMLGGKKEPLEAEKVTMKFAFASVCSIKNIRKGDKLSLSNIWVKRPGTGEIEARFFNKIIGYKATCDIPSDTQLRYNMIKK